MKNILMMISLLSLLAGCSKNDNMKGASDYNCQNLKAGISTDASDMVGTEVNKLCDDLMPAVTATDEYGQQQNMQVLVQRLSAKCDITATLICYACIKTLPAQSEIRITFQQNGNTYSRIIDISFTPQHMLVFSAMHE